MLSVNRCGPGMAASLPGPTGAHGGSVPVFGWVSVDQPKGEEAMKLSQVGVGFAMWLSVCAPVWAGETSQSATVSEQEAVAVSQVIVQIGGRFCEYHRDEVEEALRRFPAVQAVGFLNDHGTVLVRYQPDGVSPVQLAASVEQALASGIGCKAWVDRGGSPHAKS